MSIYVVMMKRNVIIKSPAKKIAIHTSSSSLSRKNNRDTSHSTPKCRSDKKHPRSTEKRLARLQSLFYLFLAETILLCDHNYLKKLSANFLIWTIKAYNARSTSCNNVKTRLTISKFYAIWVWHCKGVSTFSTTSCKYFTTSIFWGTCEESVATKTLSLFEFTDHIQKIEWKYRLTAVLYRGEWKSQFSKRKYFYASGLPVGAGPYRLFPGFHFRNWRIHQVIIWAR